jgi:hypothetical protein
MCSQRIDIQHRQTLRRVWRLRGLPFVTVMKAADCLLHETWDTSALICDLAVS